MNDDFRFTAPAVAAAAMLCMLGIGWLVPALPSSGPLVVPIISSAMGMPILGGILSCAAVSAAALAAVSTHVALATHPSASPMIPQAAGSHMDS